MHDKTLAVECAEQDAIPEVRESLPTLASACAGSPFPPELPVCLSLCPVPGTSAPNPAQMKRTMVA